MLQPQATRNYVLAVARAGDVAGGAVLGGDEVTIRKRLIARGVKNLREFGYPDCDENNILTDRIYSQFFLSMLRDNLGMGADVDIQDLIAKIEKK